MPATLVSGNFTGGGQGSAAFSFTEPAPAAQSLGAAQRGTAVLVLYGTFSGTIQLLCSIDGTNFAPASIDGAGAPNSLTEPVALFFDLPALGLSFQLATTAWASGTAYYQVLWGPSPDVAVQMPRALFPE